MDSRNSNLNPKKLVNLMTPFLVLLVVANKGGVGKTTSAHNLGFLLANKHKINVLMVDADAQCNLSAVCMRKYFFRS